MITYIAQHLKLPVIAIKYAKSFKWVYLVVFNIRRRPTFVSKLQVEAIAAAEAIMPKLIGFSYIPSLKSINDLAARTARTYQVMARTDFRQDKKGRINRGLRIKDIQTKLEKWINNYRATQLDVEPADYIRYDGENITIVRDAQLMLLAGF